MSESRARASEVVVSFAPADDRTADALDVRADRRYLARVHSGPVAVGDVVDAQTAFEGRAERSV